MRDAVLASCAVPWLFAPVQIGGHEYVDGGVWSPTNLDAAPGGRGAHVLCLVPTAAAGPLRAVTNAALIAEDMALRARGMRVRSRDPGRRVRGRDGAEPDGREPRRDRDRRGVRPGPQARGYGVGVSSRSVSAAPSAASATLRSALESART